MVVDIPHTDFILNISSGLVITRPNIVDSIISKSDKVNRLMDVPTNASINDEKSPPISRDELLYMLDSLKDLENGDYYSSTTDQTVEDFIAELHKWPNEK